MTFREKETFKTEIARAFLCSKIKKMLPLSFAFTIFGLLCPIPALLLPSNLKKKSFHGTISNAFPVEVKAVNNTVHVEVKVVQDT